MNRFAVALRRSGFIALLSLSIVPLSNASSTRWTLVGPVGGDARAFAQDPSDPSHIYLGTVSGWMYDTRDGGAHWNQLSIIADRGDFVLDNILVDPKKPSTLLVGAWVLGGDDGGLYRSTDSGHTWKSVSAMGHQSIRALTRSTSNPDIVIAGTLQGVFRSTNNGEHWSQISPLGSREIHEVESIAIDPKDPNIIYAGTWHLPWKSTDGGQHWENIRQGLIDDSDVFSIIIDPTNSSTVYLSACSGIYKSVNAGLQFTKVQGIPSTARRTRVLMQDPVNLNIVYAGTTEGLYRSTDAGHAWARMTSPDVIINDISIDPRNANRVLLATDRGGVLASDNAAVSFAEVNSGFFQRQVDALAIDPTNPARIYAGVLNDKTYGGVFVSEDGGSTWSQRSVGLAGRDIFSLVPLPNGDLLAGTNRGMALWRGGTWSEPGKFVTMVEKKKVVSVRNPKTRRITHETKTEIVAQPAPDLTARVSQISITGNSWYAATSEGIYRSENKGETWTGGPVLNQRDFHFVGAQGNTIFAAEFDRLFVSRDDGQNWVPGLMPAGLSRLTALQITPDGLLWIAGPQGLWKSRDNGESFQSVPTAINDISSLVWDSAAKALIVTSYNSKMIIYTADSAASWKYWTPGWPLRTVESAGGHLYGASLFHGVVIAPPTTAAK